MSKTTYTTGRTYNGHQVLEIEVLSKHIGESGLMDLVATFNDESRNIKGRVDTVIFPHESIGDAVLQAYDSGRYTTI